MGRSLAFLLTVLVGFALDLWTKDLAFQYVPREYAQEEVIPGFFYIAHARNDGMMWSLFQGLPAWIWIILRGTVLLLILGYYLKNRGVPGWVHFAFGLVLAGAMGNLHDNLTGDGRVRDFLRFYFWGWGFPTFNLADSMICVGAGLLLVFFLFGEVRRKERTAT